VTLLTEDLNPVAAEHSRQPAPHLEVRVMRSLISAIIWILPLCPHLLASEYPTTALDGHWEFDAHATERHVLSLRHWAPDVARHVISAYKPHSYSISKGRYTLTIDGKERVGSITVTAIRGETIRVLFTCPEQEEDEVGEMDLTEDGLIYRPDSPMFDKEALFYKRKTG